jgi:AcrR family transcriptional regulator
MFNLGGKDLSLRIEQGETTKEKILEEATRLFAKKGYYATSIHDISLASEVTKGALYHHFDSKEKIFFAVLNRIRTIWEKKVLRSLDDTGNSVDLLKALLQRQTALLKENDSICLALNFMMMEMEDQDLNLVAAIKDIYNEFAEYISHIISNGQIKGEIRKDIDPERVSYVFVGFIKGVGCSQSLYSKKTLGITDLMGDLGKILLKGLK